MKVNLKYFINQLRGLAKNGKYELVTKYIADFWKKYGTILGLSSILFMYLAIEYLILFYPNLSNEVIKKIMELIKARIKELS